MSSEENQNAEESWMKQMYVAVTVVLLSWFTGVGLLIPSALASGTADYVLRGVGTTALLIFFVGGLSVTVICAEKTFHTYFLSEMEVVF